LAKIEEKVESLIESKVNELGYSLYDVEYVKEGKDYFLRIYIENEKGISLDDCELVSNNITELLDKEDYIKEQYFLEVSSPGLNRELSKDEHFKAFIGEEIIVKLYKAIDKKKELIGKLLGFENGELTIEYNGQPFKINKKEISKINLNDFEF